ncbi:hypothetical protein EYZ11_012992 [Aspergillus tanneri]|uniref:Uncharacterized protein n=1 Tax=Aspergillus tanneri TaxID=1220188 RepID=A0A4S3IYT4_9EURO|nr:hypothetical protein EYZ11_012992 [Aspergillus tanneri]
MGGISILSCFGGAGRSRIALSGRVCFIAPFVSIGGFGRPGADYPCAGPC